MCTGLRIILEFALKLVIRVRILFGMNQTLQWRIFRFTLRINIYLLRSDLHGGLWQASDTVGESSERRFKREKVKFVAKSAEKRKYKK